MGARGRLVVAALLASACQVGGADVPIGSDVPILFYVSPTGDDGNAGTRAAPWRTLAHATQLLRPGQTLALLSGEYRADTTGLLRVECGASARQGRADAPIQVRADVERQAVVHGDGAGVPLVLSGCSHWVVEGLVLRSEHNANVPEGVDVGTVAMIQGGSGLALRRLIMMTPNSARHTHLLRVLEASQVLVEECEAYDFFHNAFEAVRSDRVTFRRNYFNSRFATSAGNTAAADDPTRGEVAIQIEESSAAMLENNVAEVVGTGFSVVARSVGSSYTEPSPYPVSGARLFGNLTRDVLAQGFRVESRCDAATPCDLPERIVKDTLIVDGVVLEATTGFWVDAAPGTRIDNVTAVDVKNGLELRRGAPNAALPYAASAARAQVRGYSGVAFWASSADDWSFEHCATSEPGTEAVAFVPADNRVLSPLSQPMGDTCVAYLAENSALRGGAGAEGDVGANVIARYVDGVLTSEPLWDPTSGAFPCGAVVAGINDDPSQSCIGAHQRLRVGTSGCALPPAP